MKKKPPSITQTMTNSPGGMQAGRDIIINQERKLTREQRDLFLTTVRSSSGEKGLVTIESPWGDSEAAKFAEQLSGLLIEGGWRTAVSQAGGYPQIPIGLIMLVRDKDRLPSTPAMLQFTLGLIGLKTDAHLGDESVQPGNIRLIVGAKP
jgi:hypothetical protein